MSSLFSDVLEERQTKSDDRKKQLNDIQNAIRETVDSKEREKLQKVYKAVKKQPFEIFKSSEMLLDIFPPFSYIIVL